MGFRMTQEGTRIKHISTQWFTPHGVAVIMILIVILTQRNSRQYSND